MTESKTEGYACPRCTVGRCSQRGMTFSEVHLGQLLAIPDVLAYVCDVCHFVEFAQETLEALWQELYGDQSDAPTAEELPALAQQKRSSSYGE